MRLFAIASAVFLAASACHAKIGEDLPQTEARYGKHVKVAKPFAPATAAYQYRQDDLAIFVGFVDGKAAYELVETIEEDGDIGEVAMENVEIEASLKAAAPEGGWTEIKDTRDGNRHWTSADGKLIATYTEKNNQLLIESAEFAQKRQASTAEKK